MPRRNRVDDAEYAAVLRSYAARHRQRLDGENDLRKQRVIFSHAKRTGLADRLLGMVATFLLSVVTDRTFLISFGEPVADLHQLFRNPGWDWQRSLHSFDGWQEATATNLDLSWKVFLHSPQAQTVMCQNLTATFADVNVLSVGTSEYWAPLIFNNPYHRRSLERLLGPFPFEVVTSFLLRPAKRLQRRLDRFIAGGGRGTTAYPAAWRRAAKAARRKRGRRAGGAGFINDNDDDDDNDNGGGAAVLHKKDGLAPYGPGRSPVVLSMHIRRGHSAMDMLNKDGLIEGWYQIRPETFVSCAKALLGLESRSADDRPPPCRDSNEDVDGDAGDAAASSCRKRLSDDDDDGDDDASLSASSRDAYPDAAERVVFIATDSHPAQAHVEEELAGVWRLAEEPADAVAGGGTAGGESAAAGGPREARVSVVYTGKPFGRDGRLNTTDETLSLNDGMYTRLAFEEALLDYWLLGVSDAVMVSTMSSVASFAPGRASLAPVVVTVDGQCVRVPPHRTQPCLHAMKDFRQPLVGEGDYGLPCPAPSEAFQALTERSGAFLPVRRLSAFYHSGPGAPDLRPGGGQASSSSAAAAIRPALPKGSEGPFPYTCISYFEDRLR